MLQLRSRRKREEPSAFVGRTAEECAHCIVWMRMRPNLPVMSVPYALDPRFYHKAKMARLELSGSEAQIQWKKDLLAALVEIQGWKRRDGGEGIVFANGMRIEEFVSYYIVPGAEVPKSQL